MTCARTASTVMSSDAHARCQALLRLEQAEQDVLGADVVVLEAAGLLAREDDDPPAAFCEAVEHGVSSAGAGPFHYGTARLGVLLAGLLHPSADGPLEGSILVT